MESTAKGITTAHAVAEIKRELAMRRLVYPKRIEAGRMDRADARQHYARLLHALKLLERFQGCTMQGVCCEDIATEAPAPVGSRDSETAAA